MEEATKPPGFVHPGFGRGNREESPQDSGSYGESDNRSTDERKQDRWFQEVRGGKKVPKRLDIPNEVLVNSCGPLKMTGNIRLIHEDGTQTHGNEMLFCRCGSSKNKPFCDNQHVEVEFLHNGSIPQASDCLPTMVPQVVTVRCLEQGPLQFTGLMRVFNRKGQQCVTESGELCRCGKSTRKPFCDCL